MTQKAFGFNQSKKNEFTFVVNELPEEAGIDPIFLLMDRMPNDNLKRVEELK